MNHAVVSAITPLTTDEALRGSRRMRAIVLTEPQAVALVDDWPDPEPGPDEVVVAIRAVGLCGSDLSVYDGDRAVPSLPWVMGHEGGGEIVATGSAVVDRHVGQRVVIEPNYCCFDCPACRNGRTSACGNRRVVGMNHPGLLAERVAVPARFAWPVPAAVADGALGCTEPLAVARTAVRRSGVTPGDRCLVVGAGSQGLFTCQTLLAAGAQVSVTEPHEGRLELAERLGAKRAEAADVEPFPMVFDTAGVPAAWETSLRAVAGGGTVVMIGMSRTPVSVSTRELVQRQVTIVGSLIYDHPTDFSATVAAVADGSVAPEQVLQAGAHPEHAGTAFAQAREAPGKSWIDLSSWQEEAA
ncbi:zinc-dependent alcohol dehydrogenase [Haloechinothrix aidingensis]|nr:alcohol dehydrogenase catalytic domain-containing protein [Haloechinothrix aidingensis]